MNIFMGRPKCQVIVDDYEIKEQSHQDALDEFTF